MSGYLAHAEMEFRQACQAYDNGVGSADEGPLAKKRLIMYGVAVLTLDAARAERAIALPDPIVSEAEQYIALVYMLRCAPAHDISEPVWKIRDRFNRSYTVAGLTIDLTGLDGQPFDFPHVGGTETFHALVAYARRINYA